MKPLVFHIKPEICSPCGGRCCKRMPGSAFPDQFPTKESLAAALASGLWAVDWWIGDPTGGELVNAYYVRPATKGMEGVKHDGSWGGECAFLTADGCSLPTSERPYECLDLIPQESGQCRESGEFNKKQAAIAWIPRQKELLP